MTLSLQALLSLHHNQIYELIKCTNLIMQHKTYLGLWYDVVIQILNVNAILSQRTICKQIYTAVQRMLIDVKMLQNMIE